VPMDLKLFVVREGERGGAFAGSTIVFANRESKNEGVMLMLARWLSCKQRDSVHIGLFVAQGRRN